MNKNIYEVEVFKEEGFVRKKCSKCGRHFWSLNPEQELCGDQPCVEYGFIGKPPKAKRLNKREFREAFLRFFKENGHSIVRRYPVVARWREDVYFVGASIYDFQPWVTSGIVPPPANPLAISQPSIRFTDLENVGRTGRHLTGFEMMAHHAFNISGKYVYWNNETVEYCFRFYKEVVQVDPEELTFIEDLWSGGGNAGEDFEVLIRGGEIATLVFMHYETGEDGTLKPMNNMIVDTGYGLERNVWVFSGKPNIYEAVYGELIEKIRMEAGVERIDDKVLLEVSKAAGILSAGEGLEDIISRITIKTGLTLEEVEKILKPYELIYKLVDYSYALAWILGDGVVASNSGAGYLARLLIRRCLRAIDELKLNLEIGWIVHQHLRNLALDFPELVEAEDKIMEMLDLEVKKYRESISKALSIAIKAIRDAKKRELTLKDLILLYDSHGLPPDLLKEKLAPIGIKVEVPKDFYSLVAKIHEKPTSLKKVEEELEFRREIEALPKTRRIYYEDAEVGKFKSKVLKVLENWVVLDSTAFYPTSGGQLNDTGILRSAYGTARVVDVKDVNGVIVHKIEGVKPAEGDYVECEIDMDRRKSLARHHTATHIILGAARRVLGPHVWQSGAEKTVEKARLDITHYKSLTQEEVEEIERLANKVIMEDRPVKCFFTSRDEAERKYGFRLYQGGVYPGRTIRIVEVEDWDVEACGGIHCKRTGEVGFIKIIGVDRIQDGVERIEYVAGEQALKYIQQKFRLLNDISNTLRSTPDKLKDSITNLIRDLKLERNKVESLTQKLIETRLKILTKNVTEVDGIKLIIERRVGEDSSVVINEANTLVNMLPDAVAIYFILDGEKSNIIVMVGDKAKELGLNADVITRNIAILCGGRGGGTARLGQGGGLDTSKIPADSEIIKEILKIKSKGAY